jgi:hypothetical protein
VLDFKHRHIVNGKSKRLISVSFVFGFRDNVFQDGVASHDEIKKGIPLSAFIAGKRT